MRRSPGPAGPRSARPPHHPARGMPTSAEERTVPWAEGVAISAPSSPDEMRPDGDEAV
jgi:hypothetical protein